MSSSWNMGYQTDLLYTYGYYKELNPLYAKAVFTFAGLAFPDMKAGYACELGFGQGVSINMHAAASDTNWYGTDFNPAQVNFAKHLATLGGINVKLHDEAFGDFAQRDDLPMFDFICIHGIWSWISRENQSYLVDFIRDHLKVGGVLYISYNVSPGFITFEPVRQLMAEFNRAKLPDDLNYNERFHAIGGFLAGLLQTNPAATQANPTLPQRINKVLAMDGHYLMGEYLNSYWDIIHFSDMAANLDRAKMSFACSATSTELLDNFNLTAEQQQFLAPYRGSTLYESIRDFMVNQQFRRDFFVKGKMPLALPQQEAAIDELLLVLTTPAKEFAYQTNARLGQVGFKKEIYQPILELMSDYKPHSVGSVVQKLLASNNPKLTLENLYESIRTLFCVGVLAAATNDISKESKERCLKINQALLRGKEIAEIHALATPVLQGAVHIQDVGFRILSLLQQEPQLKPHDVIEKLFAAIQKSGNTMNKEGKEVTDPKEQKKIITDFVNSFMEHYLPMYKALQMLP